MPSEAQWQHAARGRGERRVFAWGDTQAECCSASIGRIAGGGCTPFGPEPVESHLGSSTCDGDVTRDGVEDMTGSVSELVRDTQTLFSDPCWTSSPLAILKDPVCTPSSNRMAYGAGWSMAFGDAPLPIRRTFNEEDDDYGFRCAYEDTP